MTAVRRDVPSVRGSLHGAGRGCYWVSFAQIVQQACTKIKKAGALCLPCVPGKYNDEMTSDGYKPCKLVDSRMRLSSLRASTVLAASLRIRRKHRARNAKLAGSELERMVSIGDQATWMRASASLPGRKVPDPEGQALCLPCVPGKYNDEMGLRRSASHAGGRFDKTSSLGA